MLGETVIPQERRGEPWFEDGNVIVLTEESDIITAFKVHRGVLARHSEIFQTMVDLPPPSPDEVETADGCQVVRVYDIPEELSNLIIALYDGAAFFDRNIHDFYYVAGILRLATKYFIAHLRRQAIQHLMRTWPYTLAAHDQFVERAVRSPLVGGLTYPYVHPLHVLNLARETHVSVIVPTALYFLSLYPLPDILRADHPKLRVEHPSRPSSGLAARDLQDYTLMFQHRIDVILAFIRETCSGHTPAKDCRNRGDALCTKAFLRLGSRLSRSWVVRTGPLHYTVQAMDELSRDSSVCRACQKAFRDHVQAIREKMWEDLPGIVGLPPWKELEEMDLES